jgi:nitroreductase
MQKNKAGTLLGAGCCAASENILLAATHLVGSVWVGVYPVTLFEYQISRIINLPEGVRPLNLLSLATG